MPSIYLPPVNSERSGLAALAGVPGDVAKTRILLYTPEPVLATGIEFVLRQAKGFHFLPVCNMIEQLAQRIEASSPDIVLLDFTPDITFAFLAGLKSSKVVLWVSFISTEFAYQALGLGVRGILRKTLPTDLQVKCLEGVHGGELWFEKPLTDSFLSARRVTLTPREGQLINLLSQGLKNKEIATELTITEGTVKVYLSRLFQKLRVKDRFELALFALKNLGVGQPQPVAGQVSQMMPRPHSFVLPAPSARTVTLLPTCPVR